MDYNKSPAWRFPFVASDKWINRTLRQSMELQLQDVPQMENSRSCFELLLPLIWHNGLTSEEKYLAQVNQRIGSLTGIKSRTSGEFNFPCGKVDEFLASSSVLMGRRMSIRSTQINLISDNSLTREFLPPGPERVPYALRTALNNGLTRLSESKDDAQRAGVSLAMYFLLLTIHPFRDGNGRISRQYFASSILRASAANPVFLLSLAMMHGNRSAEFHLAAKEARAENFFLFLDMFVRSISKAKNVFRKEIDSIDRILRSSDTVNFSSLITELISIRNKLRIHMLG